MLLGKEPPMAQQTLITFLTSSEWSHAAWQPYNSTPMLVQRARLGKSWHDAVLPEGPPVLAEAHEPGPRDRLGS